jgi:hypothetical protein
MKLKETLTQIRKQVFNGELVKSNGKPYSEASKNHYNKVIKILMPLIEDIEIDQVDMYKNVDLISRVKTRKVMGDWIMSLKNKLRQSGNTAGTENVYVSVIKWYFSRIEQEFAIKIDTTDSRWNNIDNPTKMIVPETEKMIQLIKNPPKLNTENQEKAYRYIVASMITSARYKDLTLWDQTNIVKNGEDRYIVYNPHKTPNKIIEIKIIQRLSQVINEKGKLLPTIPYTTLIKSIKEVMKIAGFTEEIQTVRNIGNQKTVKTKQEWELYGCHRFRAGAITSMLSQGMSESEVKSFSGHSGNSKSFDRYVSFSRNQKNKAIEKYNKIYE